MSSQPERTEKTCLNCQAELVGRFCHVCGQENIVTKQNFWSLVTHFVYDIVHFDGKFFETLRLLLFSPGRVPLEFTLGRRQSFLQPIRMYLFTSALFFLVFFSIGNYGVTAKETLLSKEERRETLETFNELEREYPGDSSLLATIRKKKALLQDTTLPLYPSDVFVGMPFQINGKVYYQVEEYDSVQRGLPSEKRDGRVKRLFTRKLISLHKEHGSDPNAVLEGFMNDFVHNFPYMLFISLPFFAAILKLLYRRRKDLFYSDHAVFTIYHYIVSFILLLVILGLQQLYKWLDWSIFPLLIIALSAWWWIYLYKSLRKFYQQRRGKTVLKFLLLTLMAGFFMSIIFLLFIFITAYQL